jgi:hypothetical protein
LVCLVLQAAGKFAGTGHHHRFLAEVNPSATA